MFIIDSIKITGFWGCETVTAKFFHDVNIYIGDNGTGKTTFINIIYSLLSIDIDLILNMQFDSVVIFLKDGRKKRKIQINKLNKDNIFMLIKYKIGRSVYIFPLISSEVEYNRRRVRHQQYSEDMNSCKNELNKLVNISWISVHRYSYTDIDEEYYNKIDKIQKTPVDNRLDQLIIKLTKYQLQLESRVNEISQNFQRSVLEGLLYDEKLDVFNFVKLKTEKYEKIKDGLVHAYSDLGFLDESIEKKIENHRDKIQKSLEIIKSEVRLDVNDVLPLILLNRTNHIISLSKDLENKKNEIFKQLYFYKKIIEEFMTGKEIELNQLRNNFIKNKKDGKLIKISDLSSGEKQLFIILTEALLQDNNKFIFIADEPELSLHINWQKKLLKAVLDMNSNAQIIVATHSPEIAALWDSNVVNIEELFEK
jgi:ABC-type lipoprotein export system ATPase subunit